ncbi:hypothetical protein C0Q70_13454 [Pomacea canaliculata]|uniref:FAD-binding PCMH-type domain-containing protein n=1 Tax=Pomacea canaliculata TaxID=400727 RepID=A0A2T7NX95_POMCA|nr:hypothetical protein C0Q70_13454 [Pomacea canaliculata]
MVVRHYSVNACLAPLCSMHGLAVITVEGIGNMQAGLHPAQERLASAHGSQCGFCTPGFVMSMYTLLRNHPSPSAQQLESAFDGNLCRCTGYRPIIDGYRSFIKVIISIRFSQFCFQETKISQEKVTLYDPTQEPIFPPDLKINQRHLQSQPLKFMSDCITWYRPTSLKELLRLKQQHPDCRMVIGNTEIGIETKFKKQYYPVLVAVTNVAELLVVEYTEEGIRFGSSVTLSTLDNTLKEAVRKMSESKTRIFSAFIEMLQWFAGHQIRNVAALGGNIMTASPISDLNPLLLACGAVLQVVGIDGTVRKIVMDSKFFVGYRQTVVQKSEILVSVLIPFSQENEYFLAFKQANRKEDDISIVNAGLRVLLEKDTSVTDASFAFGGMAPVTVMATKTREGIIGRKWNEELLSNACQLLMEDLPLDPSAQGGLVAFRRSLTLSFFFKFYLSVLKSLHKQVRGNENLDSHYLSSLQPLERSLPRGSQVYEAVQEGQSPDDALHRPLVHQSAYKQASGEAVYLDDIPVSEDLFAAFVFSKKAHACLVSVDATPALGIPGVVDFVSHKDVPGSNVWGVGEEIFASSEVVHQGQVIGVVVAETQVIAQCAATAVKVEYEALDSTITIKEAIKKGSFFPPKHEIKRGDLAAGFTASDHVLEGKVHIEAQEHFYLECHSVLVKPGEDDELEVIATTQWPTGVQECLALALGVLQHKIVVRTKRLGGGFGGKESRSIPVTLPVAVAAKKLKRSIRCTLDRDEDMMMTGTRHPVLGRYKVGFTSNGKILALEVDMYLNAGVSTDKTIGVMDRALFYSDNCYNIANIRTTGHMCRTNLPSSTGFRGFGGPQAMIIAETWMSHVANSLKKPPHEVRVMNFYQEGSFTHFNQVLEQVTLQQCWKDCLNMSQFSERRKEVTLYNSENRWRKRGLAIIPTKFGFSFTKLDMNQGGALVHIYVDGSVLVAHGGVEMGQGLHTKMIQVVTSRVLQIPTTKITILETATNTVPNTTATAASMSSDIYGEAVREACQTLRTRLDSFIHSTGRTGMSWEELIRAAYESRINLSASGFCIIPDIGYDFSTGEGKPFSYFAYGVACSEVEIDCLTGDHVVLRTDIVMDVGKSLNPAIDVGQIEGAFVQGYGLVMLEQYKVQPDGTLLTRGPGTYKIPSLGNIPKVFNVCLLQNSRNPRAVFSSKGIGEPPLFLATSVLQAVQDAVASARQDAGLEPFIILDTPATPDIIRMACQDQFTKEASW